MNEAHGVFSEVGVAFFTAFPHFLLDPSAGAVDGIQQRSKRRCTAERDIGTRLAQEDNSVTARRCYLGTGV